MRRSILFLALALAMTVTSGLTAKEYGKGTTLAETTSMEKILADPDAWIGKRVRIEGKVMDVCPMAGCWMELEEGESVSNFRVKVDDGVIVFPVTAKGKLAVVEGTIEAIPMTREKYVDWLEHLAHERGQDFNASTVGEGPFRILQLKAEGARIEGE
jgi:hypothetical protein